MNVATKKPQARLSIAHLKAQIAPPAFQAILWALAQTLKITALVYPQFRIRLKERNLVAQIKARGYSERDPPHPWPDRSRSEEVTDGRRSIAVPIMVHDHAVAAINITWPGHRMQIKDVIAQHLSTLQSTAAAIGRAVEEKAGRLDLGVALAQLPAAALVPRP